MSRPTAGSDGPARRTVLLGLSGAALAVVAGCTGGGGAPDPIRTSGSTGVPPSPDDLARARAVATARRLLADVAATSALAVATGAALLADHRAHLVALGAPGAAQPTPAAAPDTASTTGPAAPDGAAPTTGAPGIDPAELVAAELTGAREALTDAGTAVAPDLAVVLVRVAAARAAHADLVARRTGLPQPATLSAAARPAATASAAAATSEPAAPVGLSAADVDALARLVEAEHAAFFGYALVVPRVPAAQRAGARSAWDGHRLDRDRAESLLVAAGHTPPAALPAYAVDTPDGAPASRALAARIEAGVAAVALWSVGRGTGQVRLLAADLVVAATRQHGRWLGGLPPFTG